MWYKAREIVSKPYIFWDLVAKTVEEYQAGYDDDPLVLSRGDIPDYVFGICPLKIVGGSLEERSPAELATAEDEYNIVVKLDQNKLLINDIDTGTFTYDSKVFPMDQVSRLFYTAFESAPPAGDVKCMTTEGLLYSLPNANIGAFMTAFYTQLRILSQPDV